MILRLLPINSEMNIRLEVLAFNSLWSNIRFELPLSALVAKRVNLIFKIFQI